MTPDETTSSDRVISQIVEKCFNILQSHRVTGARWGKQYSFSRPALTKYGPYQWLWDSAWHIVVWSHRQPVIAVEELRTLLQFQRDDGFIPEIIFWKPFRYLKIFRDLSILYSHQEYSDLTQIPVLAYSLRAIWNATRDKALLKELLPPLIKYMEWWESRDHDNDGLVSIIHPWESGMDASPGFDPVFHLKQPGTLAFYFHLIRLLFTYRRLKWDQSVILRRGRFNVEDIGVCSVYAASWGVLARLAGELDPNLAASCRSHYEKYQKAIIEKCWDRERGRFVSLYHQDGVEKVSSAETIQTLFPLLLDELPADIRQHLIEKIKDSEKFRLKYPLPTVEKSEPEFNPNPSRLLWRGPMWPATNWLILEGLLQHGFQDEAGVILDRWVELYSQNGIWEYYNPLTGRGAGQKELGMSTLIVDILYRMGRISNVP
jgi:glycogen debranching enzyme